MIDAIRSAILGLLRGLSGPLEEASAYYMKSPPLQMRDSDAYGACNDFIDGIDSNEAVSGQGEQAGMGK